MDTKNTNTNQKTFTIVIDNNVYKVYSKSKIWILTDGHITDRLATLRRLGEINEAEEKELEASIREQLDIIKQDNTQISDKEITC